MIKKILFLLLPVLAFIGGSFAGDMLGGGKGDDAEYAAADHGDGHDDGHGGDDHTKDDHAVDSHAKPARKKDDGHGGGHDDGHGGGASSSGPGYFTFSNQFFVPVVRNGNVGSTMILTVTLETAPGMMEDVSGREHRLRDAILRSLMIHANTGGFDGNFTAEARLRGLRESLLEAAQDVAAHDVTAVLIGDIVRQEG